MHVATTTYYELIRRSNNSETMNFSFFKVNFGFKSDIKSKFSWRNNCKYQSELVKSESEFIATGSSEVDDPRLRGVLLCGHKLARAHIHNVDVALFARAEQVVFIHLLHPCHWLEQLYIVHDVESVRINDLNESFLRIGDTVVHSVSHADCRMHLPSGRNILAARKAVHSVIACSHHLVRAHNH